MLYDGECALCMKEVNFLRKRDASKGRIDFVDIASPSYRAEDNAGITFAQVSSSRNRNSGGGTDAAVCGSWQQCLAQA
jgi:predicted DCC family thiol-disulfide oxidoreductase YuxK